MKRAIEWLESAGTFKCQRFDCPQETDKDCGVCERPLLGRDVIAILRLYRQCRQFRALPRAGGVFDQDAGLLDMFDFIDGEVERLRLEKNQEIEGELMKQRMLKELPRGRN